MKKMQEKSKRIQINKVNHKLLLKPRHRDGKHQVQNSRGQQPKHRLSQWQKSYLPETKANQTKRQAQRKMPTPPKVENTKLYQMSLDKPQDKLRSLEQQGKSNHFQSRAWAIFRSSLGHSLNTTSQNTCDLVSYAISKFRRGNMQLNI
jgi:hypothetical protein